MSSISSSSSLLSPVDEHNGTRPQKQEGTTSVHPADETLKLGVEEMPMPMDSQEALQGFVEVCDNTNEDAINVAMKEANANTTPSSSSPGGEDGVVREG